MADQTQAAAPTPGTGSSAAPATDEPVGIFISDTIYGYVEPSSEKVAEIERALRGMTNSVLPPKLLKDLLTIKQLAPAESRELRIYNIPQAVELIGKVAQVLIRRYHQGM